MTLIARYVVDSRDDPRHPCFLASGGERANQAARWIKRQRWQTMRGRACCRAKVCRELIRLFPADPRREETLRSGE